MNPRLRSCELARVRSGKTIIQDHSSNWYRLLKTHTEPVENLGDGPVQARDHETPPPLHLRVSRCAPPFLGRVQSLPTHVPPHASPLPLCVTVCPHVNKAKLKPLHSLKLPFYLFIFIVIFPDVRPPPPPPRRRQRLKTWKPFIYCRPPSLIYLILFTHTHVNALLI